MDNWKMSKEKALEILKRDNIYQKTSVNFDYALKVAIEELEKATKVQEQKVYYNPEDFPCNFCNETVCETPTECGEVQQWLKFFK